VLAIEMLPAGHGDALVVEYGTRSDTHRLLIDAGTVHSWDAVRQRLLAMPDKRYETFVITHVDEDHIGGAVRLLGDVDLRHRIADVWFNGFVHSKRGGNVLGPIDGERLTRAIRDGDYRWNDPFPRRLTAAVGGPVVVPSKGALPVFDLPGGAVLHLLSPTGPKLKRMATVWESVVTEAGLVAGAGTDRPARPPKPYHKPTSALPARLTRQRLEALAAPTTRTAHRPTARASHSSSSSTASGSCSAPTRTRSHLSTRCGASGLRPARSGYGSTCASFPTTPVRPT
jgi:hypothetical protein